MMTCAGLYQWKTNPRSKIIEEIQQWVNKEKKKEAESEAEEDNESKEDTNIYNIIDNNSSSNSKS